MGAMENAKPQVKEGGVAVEFLDPEDVRVTQRVDHKVGLLGSKFVICT